MSFTTYTDHLERPAVCVPAEERPQEAGQERRCPSLPPKTWTRPLITAFAIFCRFHN